MGSDIDNRTNHSCYSIISSDNPRNTPYKVGIPDTAATKHYITEDVLDICKSVQDTNGPNVAVADGRIMTPTKKCILPLPAKLRDKAKVAFSFDNLQSGSLISIGQLCDDDCIAIFSKYDVQIIKDKQVLIKGKRTDNGLWNIPLSEAPKSITTTTTEQMANGVIELNSTKGELAQYHAATLFNPVKSTLLYATQNKHFTSWPGLSTKLINKHLPKRMATAQGHLDQDFKNQRSTKSTATEQDSDIAPVQEPDNIKTHDIMCKIVTVDEISKSYSDQTGKFPITSSRGNKYVFVFYHYDTNVILGYALKSRTTTDICAAWNIAFKNLKSHGEAPNVHILDNECSNEMKTMFQNEKVQYQLVPPHIHRRNAAERAIRTYTNHLIAGLYTCDPQYPSREWDRLLPQCNITINLLRSSRRNASLSAYAALFGNFDYNATPMAPPGTKVLVHEKPGNRKTWAGHGTEGWYIGPSLEHYRCYKCYMPTTHAERNADTVEFFPSTTPFPQVSTDDYLRQAATDILNILQAPKQTIPTLTYGSPTTNAYIHLAQILKRATVKPANVHPQLPEKLTAAEPRVVKQLPTKNAIQTVPPPRVAKKIHQHPLITQRRNLLTKLRPTKRRINQLLQQAVQARTGWQAQSTQEINHTPQNWACPVFHPTTGHKQSLDILLKSEDKTTWFTSLTNEIGRLSQGIGKNRPVKDRIKGTNTIFFVHKTQIPCKAKITYANFICDLKPHKAESHRTRLTVGGDRLDYSADPSAPAVGLLDTKIHLNSVISDAKRGARYCVADIENFYLNNPLHTFQYMRIHTKYFTPEFRAEYDIDNLADRDGYVYCEIRKGMYGLKEAGCVAFQNLVKNLAPFGYEPMPITPGLWRHKTRRTTFTLAVDDFGIKHFSTADLDHLLNALRANYNIKVDYTGSNYCGLQIDWNYDKEFVDISIPHFVQKALHKFQHKPPTKPQHAPHAWIPPTYGQKVQYALPLPTLPILDTHKKGSNEYNLSQVLFNIIHKVLNQPSL